MKSSELRELLVGFTRQIWRVKVLT
jgi:hypothetical protein